MISEINSKIRIGSIWYDFYGRWTSRDCDIFFLVLSADSEDGVYYYQCAKLMYINRTRRYCGAPLVKYTENEIFDMTEVGRLPYFVFMMKWKKFMMWLGL